MTEIELRKNLAALLSNTPVQLKPNRSHKVNFHRELKIQRNDRLLRIIRGRYIITHAGYITCDFDGKTLLHSGKYIKYPKNSKCQRWMKRLTSKRARQYPNLSGKGNLYRKTFDYWWTLY